MSASRSLTPTRSPSRLSRDGPRAVRPTIPPSGAAQAAVTRRPDASSLLTVPPVVKHRRSYASHERQNAIKALEMRYEGKTLIEIAETLGYASATVVSALLSRAGKLGWFKTANADDHLTYKTVHKIVKNIDKDLAQGSLTRGQREMTIAAAKGRGLFKTYEEVKTDRADASIVLGVKVEVIQNGQPVSPEAQSLAAYGTPKYQDEDPHGALSR